MFGLAVFCTALHAQSVKVIYREQTKAPRNIQGLDDPRIAAAVSAKLQSMSKTMVLYYDKGTSLFEPLQTQEKEQPSDERIQMMRIGSGGICYKDQKAKESISQEYILDRAFLITEPLPAGSEWTLQNETKTVGNYTCKKAVKQGDITAWYCPELPVNDGPYLYCGLPGLILEVETTAKVITMQTVELNSQDVAGKITAPASGKKISRDEFTALMEKKKAEIGIGGEKSGVKVIQM
jgi:GLPGLI family protein